MGKTDSHAHAVASDHKGGIYIAEFDGGLQHVDLATGKRQILVQNTSGSLEEFDGMVVDGQGNLYLSQSRNHRVLVWNESSKKFSVLAGTGKQGFAGDGGPAQQALLRFPGALALTPEGDLLVADIGNYRIRKIDLHSGLIATFAGAGRQSDPEDPAFEGDAGPAVKARFSPGPMALDKNGVVFVVVGWNRVLRIDPHTGIITIVAGTGKQESTGDGGMASAASLASPSGIAIDPEGNLYISESVGNRIRRIDAVTGTITTIAGNGLPVRGDVTL